jgi:hypothetical protein
VRCEKLFLVVRERNDSDADVAGECVLNDLDAWPVLQRGFSGARSHEEFVKRFVAETVALAEGIWGEHGVWFHAAPADFDSVECIPDPVLQVTTERVSSSLVGPLKRRRRSELLNPLLQDEHRFDLLDTRDVFHSRDGFFERGSQTADVDTDQNIPLPSYG